MRVAPQVSLWSQSGRDCALFSHRGSSSAPCTTGRMTLSKLTWRACPMPVTICGLARCCTTGPARVSECVRAWVSCASGCVRLSFGKRAVLSVKPSLPTEVPRCSLEACCCGRITVETAYWYLRISDVCPDRIAVRVSQSPQ